MPYQLSKTHRPTRAFYLWGAVCVLMGGLIIGNVPMPSVLSGVITWVATPLWNVRDSLVASVRTERSNSESFEELQAERDALQDELATLRREVFMTDVLIAENKELRQIIARGEEHDGHIPASVILDSERSPYGTYILDVGADTGVRDGMLVSTINGIALGYITAVGDDHATASLFSAHGVRTGVVITGSTTLHATLEGLGSGMQIRLPRDSVVPIGAPVVVPSFSGARIGTVVQVNVTPEDAFQTIYVASPENIYTLRYVVVDITKIWAPAQDEEAETEEGGEEKTEEI